LNTERNKLTSEITSLIKSNKTEEVNTIKSKVQQIKAQIEQLENENKLLDKQYYDVMLSIPNIPHSSVPTGTDEKDNVEVRK
jgi:seryl-tRNA synthetase